MTNPIDQRNSSILKFSSENTFDGPEGTEDYIDGRISALYFKLSLPRNIYLKEARTIPRVTIDSGYLRIQACVSSDASCQY